MCFSFFISSGQLITLSEAKADPDFGAYIPTRGPTGFNFESSRRIKNQTQDELESTWSSDMKYLELLVTRLKDDNKARIVETHPRHMFLLYTPFLVLIRCQRNYGRL